MRTWIDLPDFQHIIMGEGTSLNIPYSLDRRIRPMRRTASPALMPVKPMKKSKAILKRRQRNKAARKMRKNR